MDKESSRRRPRDSDSHRDRDSSSKRHQHRHNDDDDRRRHSKHDEKVPHPRHHREREKDREGSHSVGRIMRKERSDSEERSVGRNKRKERSESEERSETRARVYEENAKEKCRLEDVSTRGDRWGIGDIEFDGRFEGDRAIRKRGEIVSVVKGVAIRPWPSTTTSGNFSGILHSRNDKVFSISKTNESKGVNINRSDTVTGKSSTDEKPSDAGKKEALSLDDLAKAKKSLKMLKEAAEKRKIQSTSTSDVFAAVAPSTSLSLPVTSTTVIPPPSGLRDLAGLTAQECEAVKHALELTPLISMFPGQIPQDVNVQPKPSKLPVLLLDAFGREIDENGKVVNVPKANGLSTLKVNINKQKKDAFQILKPELDIDPEKNPHFDASMGIDKNKLLRPKRMSFQFVEEGKWSKDAGIIKLKYQYGEEEANELKSKQAQLEEAKAEPNINPNFIEVGESVYTKEETEEPIFDIELWDVPFLQGGAYGDIFEGDLDESKIKMQKITIYIEHPRLIEPPTELAPPPPQPLMLTKKEQKKLRTQHRLAREKEKQEMIRLGVIEPPKPKVKMSNLMEVLGSEAIQDPTKLEMEIRRAAAEREQAHIDRNIARKLTPAERREKKERKLFDDPNSLDTIVSVYKVNDLSHPQARFKVDVNAQENRLTGCAIISEGMSVVVVEGGAKSIKRYSKLMLKRIEWAVTVGKKVEEEENDDKDKPPNRCVLVWQGSVAKPNFRRFFVQECRTELAAWKFFSDHGVGHYWDLALNLTDDAL